MQPAAKPLEKTEVAWLDVGEAEFACSVHAHEDVERATVDPVAVLVPPEALSQEPPDTIPIMCLARPAPDREPEAAARGWRWGPEHREDPVADPRATQELLEGRTIREPMGPTESCAPGRPYRAQRRLARGGFWCG